MTNIYGLAVFAQRMDKRVTVQVPATSGRKAYSYERETSGTEKGLNGSKKAFTFNKKSALISAGILAVVGGDIASTVGQGKKHKANVDKDHAEHAERIEDIKRAWEAKRGKSPEAEEDDSYSTLGLEKGASQGEVREAYKRIVRKHHPDIDKSKEGEETMKKANAAADLLDERKKSSRASAKGDRVERSNSLNERIDAFVRNFRLDASVTVQVPATSGKKAYSYTRGNGSKSNNNKSIKAPLAGLAAAGSLALLNFKLREKTYSAHEGKVRTSYSKHEEKIKRENNITDEDIENGKKKPEQKKERKTQADFKRLALKGT